MFSFLLFFGYRNKLTFICLLALIVNNIHNIPNYPTDILWYISCNYRLVGNQLLFLSGINNTNPAYVASIQTGSPLFTLYVSIIFTHGSDSSWLYSMVSQPASRTSFKECCLVSCIKYGGPALGIAKATAVAWDRPAGPISAFWLGQEKVTISHTCMDHGYLISSNSDIVQCPCILIN